MAKKIYRLAVILLLLAIYTKQKGGFHRIDEKEEQDISDKTVKHGDPHENEQSHDLEKKVIQDKLNEKKPNNAHSEKEEKELHVNYHLHPELFDFDEFKDGPVTEQSFESFNSNIKDNKNDRSMIFFGVPWCHYCRNFVPFYQRFAVQYGKVVLGKSSKPLKFYYVNCENMAGVALCANFRLSGYPTVVIYLDRMVYEDDSDEDTTDLTFFEANYDSKFFYNWRYMF